jgi:hypothetical protein
VRLPRIRNAPPRQIYVFHLRSDTLHHRRYNPSFPRLRLLFPELLDVTNRQRSREIPTTHNTITIRADARPMV